MTSNIDKHKEDLDRLVRQGKKLLASMHKEFLAEKTGVKKNFEEVLNDEGILADKLYSYRSDYQSWYSEALPLIKQLLPDRVSDFTKMYERPKTERKTITSENYVIEDALLGTTTSTYIDEFTAQTKGGTTVVIAGPKNAIPLFEQQLSILKSTKKRFVSSLFEIKQLVQADLFDSELDVANELNTKGFVRAAGAVAGVVLEGHLKQVCEKHNIAIKKKHPGINDLAQALQGNDVIESSEVRKIQVLADIRNKCGHKNKSEPSKEEIQDLITGVAKTIKTIS